MKRIIDLILAITGLIIIFPLLGVIALAIALTSGRPAIFRQVRIGRRGREFVICKFRTMEGMAGTRQGIFEPGAGPQVTPFGRVLRQTKLDELPQLWNVIKGDMSFVGPRPEVARWVSISPVRWKGVLSVRPGITDPASVVYRDEEAILSGSTNPEKIYREVFLPHKLDLYEEYVRTSTLMGDVRILMETFILILVDITRRKR
jgi:lipopolysaccharide/colanic/teichoic acid biosynthesis glycosyltransferase